MMTALSIGTQMLSNGGKFMTLPNANYFQRSSSSKTSSSNSKKGSGTKDTGGTQFGGFNFGQGGFPIIGIPISYPSKVDS